MTPLIEMTDAASCVKRTPLFSVQKFSRLAVLAGLSLVSLTAIQAATVLTPNLIVNGSGASPFSVGWTPLVNGGSGWDRIPQGGADEEPGYFAASYTLTSRNQLIDLAGAGFSATTLDAAPAIAVGESIMSSPMYWNGNVPDTYYIKVQLLGADLTVISSWNIGTASSLVTAPQTWTEVSHVFENYGPGVRYVYFEDGGVDVGYWLGNYGTGFDASYVLVNAVPEAGSAALAAMGLVGLASRRRRS